MDYGAVHVIGIALRKENGVLNRQQWLLSSCFLEASALWVSQRSEIIGLQTLTELRLWLHLVAEAWRSDLRSGGALVHTRTFSLSPPTCLL